MPKRKITDLQTLIKRSKTTTSLKETDPEFKIIEEFSPTLSTEKTNKKSFFFEASLFNFVCTASLESSKLSITRLLNLNKNFIYQFGNLHLKLAAELLKVESKGYCQSFIQHLLNLPKENKEAAFKIIGFDLQKIDLRDFKSFKNVSLPNQYMSEAFKKNVKYCDKKFTYLKLNLNDFLLITSSVYKSSLKLQMPEDKDPSPEFMARIYLELKLFCSEDIRIKEKVYQALEIDEKTFESWGRDELVQKQIKLILQEITDDESDWASSIYSRLGLDTDLLNEDSLHSSNDSEPTSTFVEDGDVVDANPKFNISDNIDSKSPHATYPQIKDSWEELREKKALKVCSNLFGQESPDTSLSHEVEYLKLSLNHICETNLIISRQDHNSGNKQAQEDDYMSFLNLELELLEAPSILENIFQPLPIDSNDNEPVSTESTDNTSLEEHYQLLADGADDFNSFEILNPLEIDTILSGMPSLETEV